MKKFSMALNRKEFKHKITGHLVGALLEYSKAVLAEKNGLNKWVEHWKGEVERLLNEVYNTIAFWPVRGFKDHEKVVNEVVKEIQTIHDHYRRGANNIVCHDFNLPSLKHNLTDEDFAKFWAEVDRTVKTAIHNMKK